MTLRQLFIFAFIGLTLLIFHSYFKRGFRLTLNFFLFAFIAGVRKEAGTFLGPPLSNMQYPTPFVYTNTNYPLIFCVFNTAIGWALAFYLSWCIAEKITDRLDYLRGKIFPTLFFAGLFIAALSYKIEATAINIGWWRWVFFDKHFSDFLVGGVHLFALSAWFYFAIHFLTTYFLIECSKFRKAEWKCVFFLIPFSRTFTMLFLGSDLPRMLHEYIVFSLLITLMFIKHLDFNYPEFKIRLISNFFIRRLIDIIPFIVIFIILSVLIFIDSIQIKKPHLLIALLPLVSLLLLALQKIPLWLILLFTIIVPLVFGKVGIPACIPVLAFFCLLLIGNLLKIEKYLADRYI